MSYCGLKNVKHKEILDNMVKKGLINRMEENWGSKVIINYKVSERGRLILNEILAPYENYFQEIMKRRIEINEKIKQ